MNVHFFTTLLTGVSSGGCVDHQDKDHVSILFWHSHGTIASDYQSAFTAFIWLFNHLWCIRTRVTTYLYISFRIQKNWMTTRVAAVMTVILVVTQFIQTHEF